MSPDKKEIFSTLSRPRSYLMRTKYPNSYQWHLMGAYWSYVNVDQFKGWSIRQVSGKACVELMQEHKFEEVSGKDARMDLAPNQVLFELVLPEPAPTLKKPDVVNGRKTTDWLGRPTTPHKKKPIIIGGKAHIDGVDIIEGEAKSTDIVRQENK